jgi:DNA helicase HerA-like ATPase
VSEELRQTCRRLKPLIGDAADALWIQYEIADLPAHKAEAGNLIRMMGVSYLGKQVNDREIWLPPPPEALEGEIYLGDALYPKRQPVPVNLRRIDLTRHLGIFATTGSGKTNTAFHLLRQLQEQGVPFLVIDWKRSYRNLLRDPKLQGLKMFTVGRSASPFDWNPLRPPPSVHPQTWIQILAEVLEKSHVSGQGVADILIEHTDKLFEEKGFYDVDKRSAEYPNFYDLRNRIERSRYSGRRALWQDSCLRILRTFTFGPAADAFNARQPIRIEELLEDPVVIELDMELPKNVRTFFSEAMLRWIHLHRLNQGEVESLRHVLVLEEAHNVFSADFSHTGLENIYREIRSFGEGLIAITQHCSRLPLYLLGNSGTLIIMSLTHEADVMAARQALFLNRGEEAFFDRLEVGEGIVKIKGRLPACKVAFPWTGIVPGSVTDEELKK